MAVATLSLTTGARSEDATPPGPAVASASVAGAASPDTPYASIVARNMFGLLPIPPPPDPAANQPPPEPPPKITPNGIMSIFGKDQALFKVANKPKPGQPAKEDAYVLAEGEMQDEITVVKINKDEGMITFNNHGVMQDLALVPSKDAGGGGGAGPGPGNPGGPMMRRPNPAFAAAGGFNPASARGGFSGNAGGGGNAGNAGGATGTGGGGVGTAGNNGITTLGGVPVNANRVYQPPADDVSPEESAILIEAQRLKYMQDGNPLANIMPPTPLSKGINRGLSGEGGGQPPQ
jgi:hypothetical protein